MALTVAAATVVAISSASASSQNPDAPLLAAAGCVDGTFVDTAANPVVDGPNNDLVDDCQALVAVQNHWSAVSSVLRSWGTATTTKINTWSNITVNSGRVTNLDLTRDIHPNSSLTGAIPAQLGNLTGLTGLSLSYNRLTGAIPAQLGNLTNLAYLSLSYNNLTGAIPAQLGSLTNLTRLWLEHNSLSGAIPTQLGNLTNLTVLELEHNRLTGNIPAQLGNLTNLKYLRLDNNNLTGNIPTQLGNLTNLTNLLLERNSLTGAIPAQLGNLTNLKHLQLSYNSLTGAIPAQLGNLTNLASLGLAHNNLTGAIPTQLSSLARSQGGSLVSLDLCGNSLTGEIPSPLRSVRSSYCIRPPTYNPYRPTTTTTTTTTSTTTTTTTTTPSGSTTTTTTTAPPRVSVCGTSKREWPALSVESGGASISAIRAALIDDTHSRNIYRWNQTESRWDRVTATTGTLPEGTIITLRCVTTDTDTLFNLNLLGSTKQISLQRYNNIIIAPEDLTRPQGTRSSYLIDETLTTCRGTLLTDGTYIETNRDSGITSIIIRNSATGKWSISFPCRPDLENKLIAKYDYHKVSSISQGDLIYLNFIATSPYNDNYDIYWDTQTRQYKTGTGPTTN